MSDTERPSKDKRPLPEPEIGGEGGGQKKPREGKPPELEGPSKNSDEAKHDGP